jgi:hypothetical protein
MQRRRVEQSLEEVLMKRVLMAFVASVVVGSLAYGQTSRGNSIEQPFVEGGMVRLRLASSDYTVRAGANDRIVVEWRANDAAHAKAMSKIEAHAARSGNAITIHTKGPANRARFTIEIPARSDLDLRMRAGDVRIDGVEGNKDIRMTAGDLDVEVLPASYAYTHASVRFGDLRARPLGISKDGIGNSFDWIGAGKYTLNATMFAGDLTFSPARGALR